MGVRAGMILAQATNAKGPPGLLPRTPGGETKRRARGAALRLLALAPSVGMIRAARKHTRLLSLGVDTLDSDPGTEACCSRARAARPCLCGAAEAAAGGAEDHTGTAGVRRGYHGVGAVAHRTRAHKPWLDHGETDRGGARGQLGGACEQGGSGPSPGRSLTQGSGWTPSGLGPASASAALFAAFSLAAPGVGIAWR